MKWQIRQISENYADKAINGLFYITNGELFPDDTYFCRDGKVRDSAIPLNKEFQRKRANFNETALRQLYLTSEACAYYEQKGHALYTLNTFKQEYHDVKFTS